MVRHGSFDNIIRPRFAMTFIAIALAIMLAGLAVACYNANDPNLSPAYPDYPSRGHDAALG